MTKQIMTPKHPRWIEFVERLEGPEGCNFREENGRTVWNCGAGKDKTKAESILRKMGSIKIKESLAFFENHGGYCDCEILFNVEDAFGEL